MKKNTTSKNILLYPQNKQILHYYAYAFRFRYNNINFLTILFRHMHFLFFLN